MVPLVHFTSFILLGFLSLQLSNTLKHIFKFKYLKNTGLWIVVEHSPLKQLILIFRKIPFTLLWEPSLPSFGLQERQEGLNLPVFLCSKAGLLPRTQPESCTEAGFYPGSFLSCCSLDFSPARLHFLLSPQMPPALVLASSSRVVLSFPELCLLICFVAPLFPATLWAELGGSSCHCHADRIVHFVCLLKSRGVVMTKARWGASGCLGDALLTSEHARLCAVSASSKVLFLHFYPTQ